VAVVAIVLGSCTTSPSPAGAVAAADTTTSLAPSPQAQTVLAVFDDGPGPVLGTSPVLVVSQVLPHLHPDVATSATT
jgi:hypothetical protein